MAKHFTGRGEPIDMAALIAQNAKVAALGNANMNARGDILGQDGVILKTQEQIEAEWAAQKAKQKQYAPRTANIKAPMENIVDGAGQPPQKNLTADQDFEPDMNPTAGRQIGVPTVEQTPAPQGQTKYAPRRKIVETE